MRGELKNNSSDSNLDECGEMEPETKIANRRRAASCVCVCCLVWQETREKGGKNIISFYVC